MTGRTSFHICKATLIKFWLFLSRTSQQAQPYIFKSYHGKQYIWHIHTSYKHKPMKSFIFVVSLGLQAKLHKLLNAALCLPASRSTPAGPAPLKWAAFNDCLSEWWSYTIASKLSVGLSPLVHNQVILPTEHIQLDQPSLGEEKSHICVWSQTFPLQTHFSKHVIWCVCL